MAEQIAIKRQSTWINEITKDISILKIQARVMTMWVVKKYHQPEEDQSLEMILLDEKEISAFKTMLLNTGVQATNADIVARVVKIIQNVCLPLDNPKTRKIELELEDTRSSSEEEENITLQCTPKKMEDDWFNAEKRKTLKEMKKSGQKGDWIVLGTIEKILSNYAWYYDGCSACGKKVEFENDIPKCGPCNQKKTSTTTPITVVPRYRLSLEIKDSTDTADIVVWDEEASKLLKRTAADIKKEADEMVSSSQASTVILESIVLLLLFPSIL
ncbi:hypothetical protein RIF29_21753 [Crotalaria pallida]|uniref:Replication factor A C-terminal domain-containing protein n=1 Tax=Crotalaria pallida TaxID=3830 RepID=A0AAN9F7Y3_CROPI